MRIIIPMAGAGKRMRPHTLTTPKPLLPVAGKPMVQRIVEDIARVCDEKVEEVAYVVGRFGEEAEKNLVAVAERLGARGSIWYQDEPLGTAHAILCAEPCLKGKVVVAFADTLFRADFKMDSSSEGTIWVQQIKDPRQFGVVKVGKEGFITDFVEKPQEFVSDLAIIGIYYFRDGDYLKKELRHLLDNNIREKGEYQLTNALENMKKKGTKFVPGKVSEWLDCGNKDATVHTNGRILEFVKERETLRHASAEIRDSKIVEPCFIGANVKISESSIGPYVSIGNDSVITGSVIKNSIIQSFCSISNSDMENSMLGNHVSYSGKTKGASLGDYSTHEA